MLDLFSTMRPKIQLSAHDVEFQWQERAKSDLMRRELLISQEKNHAIIKFKPPTFVLPPLKDIVPPLKDIVPPKNNHMTYSPRNSGSSSFLPRKNLFSLSKTTPFCLEKGNLFTLPSSSSSFSIPAVVVFSVAATDDAVFDEAASLPSGVSAVQAVKTVTGNIFKEITKNAIDVVDQLSVRTNVVPLFETNASIVMLSSPSKDHIAVTVSLCSNRRRRESPCHHRSCCVIVVSCATNDLCCNCKIRSSSPSKTVVPIDEHASAACASLVTNNHSSSIIFVVPFRADNVAGMHFH